MKRPSNDLSTFRTIINPQKSTFFIKWGDPVLLWGSCFSENIGQKIEQSGFETDINPFGIQYNPRSILKSVERVSFKRAFAAEDLKQTGERYFSFETHSSLAGNSEQSALELLNHKVSDTRDFIEKSPTVIVTLGTAWIYKYLETGETVANCFKIPNNEFSKRCLKLEEVETGLFKLIDNIRNIAPRAKFIFTLSPVRHWKDGVRENSVSKSILNLALHKVCKEAVEVSYFPAYEILLDDLRDYRFYKSDMLHPNETAVDYIWQKFSETYFSEEDQVMIERMKKLAAAKLHRPREPKSAAHQKFLRQQIAEVKELQKIKATKKLSELSEWFSEQLS